jgi:hypothetical protein
MRSFLPLTSVVFGVRQKLLDEDNLPSVFNLDDKAITVAFDVEQYTDPRVADDFSPALTPRFGLQ